MVEQWLLVKVEGILIPGYEVSDLGRVRTFWLSGCKPRIVGVPKFVKGYPNRGGKIRVDLRLGRSKIRAQVHLLVLEAFVGSRPEGLVGCHGPSGSSDNSLTNLSWKTYSENLKEDKIRDGTSNRGEQNGCSKLTEEDVHRIRRLASKGYSYEKISKIVGKVSGGGIRDVVLGINWAWLPYKKEIEQCTIQ